MRALIALGTVTVVSCATPPPRSNDAGHTAAVALPVSSTVAGGGTSRANGPQPLHAVNASDRHCVAQWGQDGRPRARCDQPFAGGPCRVDVDIGGKRTATFQYLLDEHGDILREVISRPQRPSETKVWRYDSNHRLVGRDTIPTPTKPSGIPVNDTSMRVDYDDRGRVARITTVHDDGSTTVKDFLYDNLDRLVAWRKGTGATTVEYDALGRVASLVSPGETIDSRTSYAYDAQGRISEIRDEEVVHIADMSRVHLTQTTYEYGPSGKLRAMRVAGEPGAERTFAYTYDSAGRLAQSDETIPTVGTLTKRFAYVCDADAGR